MEWVETKGKSLEEAKERAFEQLGVSEMDAELVVLAEPKTGLFGRVRGEARVRARVRPVEPRPKRTRRQRSAQGGGRGAGDGARQPRQRSSGGGAGGDGVARGAGGAGGNARGAGGGEREPRAAAGTQKVQEGAAGQTSTGSAASRRRRRRRGAAASKVGGGQLVEGVEEVVQESSGGESALARNGVRRATGTTSPLEAVKEEQAVAEEITLAEQAAVAKEFLEGLLDRYGVEATIEVRELDEETVELAAHGEGLGVLVGPKGATVSALQDVTRTVVQKHFPSRTDRILVDVAGYRERRVAALRRFAAQVAAEVLESRTERALEPMSAADRKVVHDTVVTIDGVTSSSQGEEPRRFVVISPAG
ncbi:MAG: RNA-binding cell elongation regulator Jag/EloR [Acidimicrobiales bacterium]